MRVSGTSAVLASLVASALAAPASAPGLSRRTDSCSGGGGGGGGGGGSTPPPSASNNCQGGVNVCNAGGKWSKKDQADCTNGDTYCCAVTGNKNALNCNNIANNDPITISVGSISGLNLKRDLAALEPRWGCSGGGGSSSPPPTPPASNTCSGGINVCNAGGKWSRSDSATCSNGDTYCCTINGNKDEYNCNNVLNNSPITVSVGDIDSGSGTPTETAKKAKKAASKRDAGGSGGWPGSAPPASNSCSGGINVCNAGGKWSKKDQADCTNGDTYCCAINGNKDEYNCNNVLDNSPITINIGDISGEELPI